MGGLQGYKGAQPSPLVQGAGKDFRLRPEIGSSVETRPNPSKNPKLNRVLFTKIAKKSASEPGSTSILTGDYLALLLANLRRKS
ncbi:hypothetical protein D3C87_1808840 [compost metagenome]